MSLYQNIFKTDTHTSSFDVAYSRNRYSFEHLGEEVPYRVSIGEYEVFVDTDIDNVIIAPPKINTPIIYTGRGFSIHCVQGDNEELTLGESGLIPVMQSALNPGYYELDVHLYEFAEAIGLDGTFHLVPFKVDREDPDCILWQLNDSGLTEASSKIGYLERESDGHEVFKTVTLPVCVYAGDELFLHCITHLIQDHTVFCHELSPTLED